MQGIIYVPHKLPPITDPKREQLRYSFIVQELRRRIFSLVRPFPTRTHLATHAQEEKSVEEEVVHNPKNTTRNKQGTFSARFVFSHKTQ